MRSSAGDHPLPTRVDSRVMANAAFHERAEGARGSGAHRSRPLGISHASVITSNPAQAAGVTARCHAPNSRGGILADIALRGRLLAPWRLRTPRLEALTRRGALNCAR